MIDLENFTAKLKDYSLLTGQLIKSETAKALHQRLKFHDEDDVNNAIEDLAISGERLTLANLNTRINRFRAIRLEAEATVRQKEEGQAAQRFWHDDPPDGDSCKWGQCRGCRKLDHCSIRAKEWLAGIRSIYNFNGQRRPKGEGKKKAEEIICYMNKDFMGGIERPLKKAEEARRAERGTYNV